MPKVAEDRADTEETKTLDEMARDAVQKMLKKALQEEVAAYLERHPERDDQGHRLVVRNGKAKARKVTCGADDRSAGAASQRQACRRGRRAAALREQDPPAVHATVA